MYFFLGPSPSESASQYAQAVGEYSDDSHGLLRVLSAVVCLKWMIGSADDINWNVLNCKEVFLRRPLSSASLLVFGIPPVSLGLQHFEQHEGEAFKLTSSLGGKGGIRTLLSGKSKTSTPICDVHLVNVLNVHKH